MSKSQTSMAVIFIVIKIAWYKAVDVGSRSDLDDQFLDC